MSAVVEQPTLFPIVEKGSVVDVFHESGDLEGRGTVLGGVYGRGWIVKLEDGRTIFRTYERVVLA